MTATFDPKENLWIDFDGMMPPHLMLEHPEIFLIEHDAPHRCMINLTAYIALQIHPGFLVTGGWGQGAHIKEVEK